MTGPSPARPDAALPAPLLAALEDLGPRPALIWYGPDGRTELSGHVLANWVIKAIGHLADEIDPAPGEDLVLDLPAHWKRLVLALAGWSLGLRVSILDEGAAGAPGAPRILATDHPGSARAGQADEVLALAALSLSLRFPEPLAALQRDWVQEVRASPDVLQVPTAAWSGPAPVPAAPGTAVLLTADGTGSDAPAALGAWLAGSRAVGPSAALDAATARSEGVPDA